jgi:ribonuclease HI
MTWGKYEGASADAGIEGPNHTYGQWFHFANPISKAEVIRSPRSRIDTTIHLYTDGSSKGSQQTRDRKCFSGWGCNMVIEGPNGSSRNLDFNGGLYNADPHTAELSAVYQALIRVKEPCKIHIHSDSQYVITALKNLPEFISKRTQAIELIDMDKRSVLEKIEMTRLDLWKRVEREINKPMIMGVTIQWIKSHQMDDMAFNPENQSPEAIKDIKGNDIADKLSNMGVINGVVTALEKLSEIKKSNDIQAFDWSSKILKKNFTASSFCKEVAIVYLVEKPNLLTQDIIRNILDPYSATRIECAIRDGITVQPAHNAVVKTLSAVRDIIDSRPKKVNNEHSYSRT